jgi:polysaccharide deacetylase 2 family uncharacterized protein YibQ
VRLSTPPAHKDRPHFGSVIISTEKKSQFSRRFLTAIFIVFGISLCGLFLALGLSSSGVVEIKKKISRYFIHAAPDRTKNNSGPGASPFIRDLYDILGNVGVNPSDSSQFVCRKFIDPVPPGSKIPDTLFSLSARVPKGHPFEWLVWDMARAASRSSYRTADCVIDEKKQRCMVSFLPSDSGASRIRLVLSRSERFSSGASKMAIIGEIVEDSAFQTIVAYLSLPEKVSVSVLPGKKQSTLTTQLANQYHKEVLIRLPLEPATKIPSGFPSPVIMVHYSKENIRSIMAEATASVPHSVGFVNIWGSRALEDSRIMNIILSEIRDRKEFFVEMRTTKNSLAPAMAETLGVPYEEITGAVSEKTKAEMEKQLKSFCLTAQLTGSAIITAPVTPALIAALKATLPWLRQNGVLLVPVSDLVHKRDDKP